MDQKDVLATYRTADIFALACRITADGDRRTACPTSSSKPAARASSACRRRYSGVPELLTDGINGRLVPPEDPEALSIVLNELIRDPARRHALGAAAEARVHAVSDFHTSIRQLVSLFEAEWEKAR